ncbi:hypothetical protein C8J56DRAFT_1046801 [Mycena floridula]|nr:hypothetical protein C8J56DRAFT_1046801 [Mycena floridula]
MYSTILPPLNLPCRNLAILRFYKVSHCETLEQISYGLHLPKLTTLYLDARRHCSFPRQHITSFTKIPSSPKLRRLVQSRSVELELRNLTRTRLALADCLVKFPEFTRFALGPVVLLLPVLENPTILPNLTQLILWDERAKNPPAMAQALSSRLKRSPESS